MKRVATALVLVFVLVLVLAKGVSADIGFDSFDAVTIDFAGFTASGFAPEPTAGQLDSDNWIATGFSDGSVVWGGTNTSGDFARGRRAFGATTGGVYSFTNSPGGACLGVQPSSDDFTPGSLILRMRNNTVFPIVGFTILYKIFCFNDQNRANSFNFSFSTNGVDFFATEIDYTSSETADATVTNVQRVTSPSGIEVLPDQYLYFKWSGDDVGGSGFRDEFALDDVVITPYEGQMPHPWTLHVAPGSPEPYAPYWCWSNAAPTIQIALDIAQDGDTVLLTNNVVFSPLGTVSITNGITLRGDADGPMPSISGQDTHRVVRLAHSNAVIENVHITAGQTSENGGGVYLDAVGARVSECLITSNTADYGGGVFFAAQGGCVERCRIRHNHCTHDGGGVYVRTNGQVRNCLVWKNTAEDLGGGVECYAGGVVESCTIVSNTAERGGGLDFCVAGSVRNSIVALNAAPDNPNWQDFLENGEFHHVCTTPLPPGTNNIAADPLFVDAASGDYHLQVTSPCVDAADPTFAPALDLDGKSRPIGNVGDIGCCEFGPIEGTNSPVHYVATSGAGMWPYLSWTRAATNIQQAVDVAAPGDTVLVSNGVYAAGSVEPPGRASHARVSVTNAITLRGVNGPAETRIQGAVDSKTGGFGSHAVRCLYLDGDAFVSGFTLEAGHTADSGTGEVWDRSGGAVLFDGAGCLSNCVLASNAAAYGGGACCFKNGGSLLDSCVISNAALLGGGVYCVGDGLVDRAEILANSATNGAGGAYLLIGGRIANSLIADNSTPNEVGGVHCQGEDCNLQNVTIAGNNAGISKGGLAAYDGGTVWNSIVQQNTAPSTPDLWMAGSPTVQVAFCCAPGLSAEGCITNDPLFVDAAQGDYRLEVRSPCRDAAATGLLYGTHDLDGQPRIADGTPDIGAYEVQNVHFVSLSGAHRAPFVVWADAATNIQAAVDVAEAGHIVLVTNGVYALGGAAMPGRLILNRVLLTNAVTVRSVNGPGMTTIRGDGTGGAQTRCAYLGHGAEISGFRLENGTTRSDGHSTFDGCGAGAFLYEGGGVSNCVVANCDAGIRAGGGLFFYDGGSAVRCTVLSNRAERGAGAFVAADGTISDCLFAENTADDLGGGIACDQGGTVVNCTVARNQADRGGGVYAYDAATFVNSIIYTNIASPSYENYWNEGSGYAYKYCCLAPLIPDTGNTNADPAFVDLPNGDYHLTPKGSPCIDAGDDAAVLFGLDLDGASRIGGKAVDMGAYEYGQPEVTITGAASVVYGEVAQTRVAGTNNGFVVGTMTWSNHASAATGGFAAQSPWTVNVSLVFGSNTITVTGWNGIGEDASDTVTILRSDEHGGPSPVHYAALAGNGWWPYTNWTAAATNIQDAVDAAVHGDAVLLGDGTYTVPQQISVAKGVRLTSLNGPAASVIQAGASNRCVYMAHSNAILEKVTVRDGNATHGGGIYVQMPGGCIREALVEDCQATYGAGVFFAGVTSGIPGVVDRCVIRHNGQVGGNSQGGGVYLRDIATAKNCLFYGNAADEGAGLFCCWGGIIRNCTVVSNDAALNGGGIWFYGSGAQVHNCIVCSNGDADAGNYGGSSGCTLSYCCTDPIPPGSGHVAPPAGFLEPDAHDYRIGLGSPCIDAGADASAWLTNDLDGIARPLDGNGDGTNTFDVGCYEYDSTVVDTDADGLTDAAEQIADTNPTNAQSCFQIIDIAHTNSCTVWFNCSTARVYELQWLDNLCSGQWSVVEGRSNMPGAPAGTTSLTDTNEAQRRFYRVGVRYPQ